MGVGALTHEYEMGALRRRYVTKTHTCASECINQKSAGLFDGFVDCRHSWGRGEEKTISPPPLSLFMRKVSVSVVNMPKKRTSDTTAYRTYSLTRYESFWTKTHYL